MLNITANTTRREKSKRIVFLYLKVRKIAWKDEKTGGFALIKEQKHIVRG